MLSRKSKDKSIKGGVIGKYVKKDEPPEIPSKYSITDIPCLKYNHCYFKQLSTYGQMN